MTTKKQETTAPVEVPLDALDPLEAQVREGGPSTGRAEWLEETALTLIGNLRTTMRMIADLTTRNAQLEAEVTRLKARSKPRAKPKAPAGEAPKA